MYFGQVLPNSTVLTQRARLETCGNLGYSLQVARVPDQLGENGAASSKRAHVEILFDTPNAGTAPVPISFWMLEGQKAPDRIYTDKHEIKGLRDALFGAPKPAMIEAEVLQDVQSALKRVFLDA